MPKHASFESVEHMKHVLGEEARQQIQGVESQLAQTMKQDDILSMANMGQDVKEAMTGGSVAVVGKNAVLTENIVDKQVTHEKTTFAQKGKNLFNGIFLNNVIIAGSPPGEGTFASRVGGYSAVIKVTKGKTYTISKADGTDRFGIGVNIGYPTLDAPITRYAYFDNLKTTTSITLTGDEDHIIVYLSSPAQNLKPLWFQVEEGAEQTSYESPYAVNLTLSEKTLEKIRGENVEESSLGFVKAVDFGVSTESSDNKLALQQAIDYASSLVTNSNDRVKVWLPKGLYWVNGTIYLKSGVELVGDGIIKATNNANFDNITFTSVDTLRPAYSKVLVAVVGNEATPIKNSGVRGITIDFNGENQLAPPDSSFTGLAIVHAEDCYANDVNSLNCVYENIVPEEGGGKRRALCLLVAFAKRTKINGGRYWKSGYDAIRVAAGAEDTILDGVYGGKAKRGAIQITPLSKNTILNNCIFDNREGSESSSHAFFAHNMQTVTANNLILRSKKGFCMYIFSDGNLERYGYSKDGQFKNIHFEAEEHRVIGLQYQWTKGISIQGIVKMPETVDPIPNVSPILLRGVSGIDLDLNIPYSRSLPFTLNGCRNIKIKTKVKTNEHMYGIVVTNEENGIRCSNIDVYDSEIDCPNLLNVFRGYGNSDRFKIRNTRVVSGGVVEFTAGDTNTQILDCDFTDVTATDKLAKFNPTSGVVRNIIGAETEVESYNNR